MLACFLAWGLAASFALGQSTNNADLATLQGAVRDERGHPLAAAMVYLQAKNAAKPLAAVTDAEGVYRFPALQPGDYKLRAEAAGYGEATAGPFALGTGDAKRIDLNLGLSKAEVKGSSSGTPGTAMPEFYDEPRFTVAGVTEAMTPGGHGSDKILRTSEALTKDAVSLGDVPVNSAAASRSNPAPTATPPGGATEQSLRHAAERQPESFEANLRFGQWLVDEGKAGEALSWLQRAARLSSDAPPGVTAGLDHLLGEVEEQLGNPLQAVREYQRAAELNPSEPNLFDWGSELLMHRAPEPAIEVFTQGNRLFPESGRMLVALGVAWYAKGSYDRATQCLCEASDLNPEDPNPYLFLGKMESVQTMESQCPEQELGRYAKLQPENALANYYYATSLKRRKGTEDKETAAKVESLLKKAVRLDPKLSEGYLQLGILYSDQKDFPKAISLYEEAIASSPELPEAHYRLALAYARTGDKLKAQQELRRFDETSKKTAEEVEHERREIQQFVYTLRSK